MTDVSENKEALADRRADRRALIAIGVMTSLSLLVSAASKQAEFERARFEISPAEPWLTEGTSHLVVILLALLLPFIVARAPLVLENWRQTILLHFSGWLLFSLLHISLMYALRLALFPAIAGYAYRLNLLAPPNFIYEVRKDLFTYALLMVAFYLFRAIEQGRLEVAAAAAAARASGTLTLKSGGARFVVSASDIQYAKAAGNYVEVTTPEKTFLARMTLARLSHLLDEAGGDHLRVHRSCVVKLSEIAETEPTGEGSLEVVLRDGQRLVASRQYRKQLEARLSE